MKSQINKKRHFFYKNHLHSRSYQLVFAPSFHCLLPKVLCDVQKLEKQFDRFYFTAKAF